MYYFAYGSNIDETDLEKWCKEHNSPIPQWKLVGVGCLKDYELFFNYYSQGRKGGAANLMKKSNGYVYGLLFELNDYDLETIRMKEGYPNYYKEIKVNVLLNNSEYKDVLTYKVVKEKELQEQQKPTKHYMNLIIKNAEKYDFPEDYRTFLSTIPTQE